MKNSIIVLVAFLFVSVSVLGGSKTDNEPASAFAGEYGGLISNVHGKIVKLAEAVPQDNYSWRPADEVRSISEVYLHLAFSCYYLLDALGEEIPVKLGMEDAKKFEKSTLDKKEIAEKLNSAFSMFKEASNKVTDEKLNSKINFFGNEMSVRTVMMIMLNHAHEHFGQSIAYARTNGVVPPWSAGDN